MLCQVIVMFTCICAVNAGCAYSSWLHSFDTRGQSKCDERDHYIRGLRREHFHADDDLRYLEGVDCCSAPTNWSNTDALVVYEDWTHILDSINVWAYCPSGYFLQGLYRSDDFGPFFSGYLHNIETARCAKPATHPFYYGNCYVQDIPTFDREGTVTCREGYYVTGLYKSNGDYLHFLDQLRCCAMANEPQKINSVEVFKTHVMDSTLTKFANLANMMGYGWCAGNRGVNIGDDFERIGDTWEASTKLFYPNFHCEGHKCWQRLKITYGNWNFEVKNIVYGQRVFDDLQTESIDSRTIYNNHNTETTESFTRSQIVEETITHRANDTWTNSHEAAISLNFNIPYLNAGSSISYTARYENSHSTTNERKTINSTTLSKSTSKTIPPLSSARYNVLLRKSRITLPYTAVILLKFSTEFQGFLRWGQGYASPTTNYHYQHRGSGDRPRVNYRFGDSSVPFYKALKNQVDSQSRPWLWNEMLSNYPTARSIINSLTNEGQYEITLSGILEYVQGTAIDIVWENSTRVRRSMHDDLPLEPTMSSNVSILAIAGPNDHPVKVEFPKVTLVKADQVDFEIVTVDKNSV